MGPIARTVGGVSILLAPALTAAGFLISIAVYPPAPAGPVNPDYDAGQALADLAAIESQRGLYTAGGALVLVVALVGIPALLALWRVSVAGSRRWAWAGAVLAALGVVGGGVHAVDPGLHLVALDVADRAAAAEFLVAVSTHPFVVAVFVPVLLGILAPLPQAVALVRARVVPVWAGAAIAVGAVVMYGYGDQLWGVASATVAMLAGLAPAARAVLRGELSGTADEPVRQPAGR